VTAARRAFSVAVYARRGGQGQDQDQGEGGASVLVIEHRRLGPGETPLEAAARELREETGLEGVFRSLRGALDGVPAGLLGYEEHQAGSKGLHMNFVFVAEVAPGAEVRPNDEFEAFRWVGRAELEALASPLNVRQFGYLALDAVWA
jgi:8-oxo-dGTP pyrophosphatase MutT (NUDIX family)